MSGASLRVLFAGTPDFAASHLKALIESKHQLIAVLTQPDRPSGRGKKLTPGPVKALAQDAGIEVLQPASLKGEDEQATLRALGADVMIVVAYGLILPQAVLDICPFGCLNVHGSILPRWRGAAPIQRAVEAGDGTSGITIMQMDAGLDTGAMLAKVNCAITTTTTGGSLHDELARVGPPLLLEVLEDLPGHQARAQVQDDSLATYAHKISKAEAQIDWRLPARDIDRRVRAFNPFPVCFTLLGEDRVRVWQAVPLDWGSGEPGVIAAAGESGIAVHCGEGQLLIESLQLPGGKVLTAAQVLTARAEQFTPGTRFALPEGE